MDLECKCLKCKDNNDGWCWLGWNIIDENGMCSDKKIMEELNG